MNINKQFTSFNPHGCINIPSSKSYSHRYLISAFIANRKTTINNVNVSDDVLLTLKALEALGGHFSVIKNTIIFESRDLINNKSTISINVGQSGSTLRLILPIACYLYDDVIFYGDESLFNRPLDIYEDVLKNNSIQYEKTSNNFHVIGKFNIQNLILKKVSSSQFISGLIFYSALSKKELNIKCDYIESKSYVDMTLKTLNDYGYCFDSNYKLLNIKEPISDTFNIETDISSSAFFLTLGSLKGSVTINNFPSNSLQGDKKILEILKSININIVEKDNKITVNKSNLTPFDCDISNCIDLGPILFVLASLINGKSHISGIDRLKYKESNRISSMIEELTKIGTTFELKENEIFITGREHIYGDYIFDSHNDHRVAMSLAVLATVIEGKSIIMNAGCVNKSYPNFYNDLDSLKSKIAVGIYNLNTLNKCIGLIDSAILGTSFSSIYQDDFDLDEAISICIKNNVEPILSLNKIFTEDEMDEVKEFINKYKDYKFLVSDLGIVKILEDIGINNFIYHPDTLICNSLDIALYQDLGINTMSMSNEITIEDLISSYSKTNANIFYQVFGRKVMFYSKRKLFTLYKQFKNVEFGNNNLSLVEEKRDYQIPTLENKNGFYCYRPYCISLLKEIKKLTFLKYMYFESFGINDEELIQILKVYKDVINDSIEVEDGLKIISNLNIKIEDGFTYSDSIYVKEKIVQ